MKRAMKRLPRLLAPSTLICALLAALAFAATASAEVRAGEATSPANPAIPGKGDILSATANYDVAAGAMTFAINTREAAGEKDELTVGAILGQPKEGACSLATAQITLPVAEIFVTGPNPEFPEVAPARPSWAEISEVEGRPELSALGLAKRSLNGTTDTLSATSTELAGKPFSCATISIETPGSATEPPVALDEVTFPLHTLPEPPPAPKPAPPAPAALAFASSKPVTAKTGKWTKVKVTVANTGGTTVGPIAFKAKAPAGVVVKPGSPKLPALLGGQTWTINLQVKLTEKAKPQSTITVTGTAGSLTATGSVVVKPAG
jgi:hypothetical protein